MIKVTVSLNGVERTINGNGQHIKGTISQEVGAINSFEFEIFPQNIGFELIQSRKTLVKAINTVTKRVEFAGRVLLAETKMESNGVISKRVTCESYLGYLYDSVQPFAAEQTTSLRDFLQIVINNHNARVESEKRMQLGTVNVEVAGTGNVTKGLQYETTYDTIKSKLVDIFGGELEVVENEGGLTLNYVNQIGTTRATTIELGRNMQAASREVSPLNIITRIIPLGAKIKKEVTDDEGNVTEEETSERLTLVGYAPVAGEPAFSVPWIDDEEKQKECGIVCGKIEFDDVTTQSSLYRKTLEYMQNENLVALSHTLTALDLKEIGQDIDGLNCGDSYPVKNVLIGLDEVLRITKKTIDINAPYKGSITIGEKRATLSSIQAGTNATIGELFGAIETIHKATNSLKEHVSSTDKSVNELNTKVEGIEGTFFYIRYSPYADGHVMTDAPEENTEYMGTCSTNENKAPTDYKKYTWVRVKGEQGEQGVAGESGKDGKATYFHVKFSDVENPTTSEQMTETPSKYIGTYVDYTEADSTDPAKYKWIKFTGEDGENGLAGENGEDGKTYYLHIKYSNDGGESFTANGGETTGEYIGVYTDTTEADSDVTTSYKWSKIKGEQGEAGETGADGKTSYLHIKYSDDGATFTENNGETLGAWIGTYVDFNEYDSTVFSDYTWKKFTEDVDEELEEIRSTVVTLSTDITNNSDSINLMASKEYVETTTYEGFKQTIEENIASLQVENDEIDLKFENKTTEINDNVETKFTEIYKYFKFTENGLEILSSDSKITLVIDNDLIIFKKNGVAFGWWDGENFHTGNIVVEVNERAQFGNFAFIPRASGSLSFLKVAGENELTHTHIYADIITLPTETEGGYTTHLCKLCGESYIDSYTQPTGHIHNYTVATVAPTCTTGGYTEHTCIKCGDTYREDETEALGHTSGLSDFRAENVVNPTCTEAGSYTKVKFCSRCQEELSRTTVTLDATGHTDSNGDGICETCGEVISSGEYTITAGETKTVNVEQCVNGGYGENVLISDFTIVKFVPTVSGVYQFEVTNGTGTDTCGRLYDTTKTEILAADDDNGTGSHFLFTYECKAGTIYYVAVKFFGSGIPSGTADLLVTLVSSSGGTTQQKEITIYSSDGSLRVDCNGANLINATRNDFKYNFNYGEQVTLTFTPDSGASFYEWSDEDTFEAISDENPYTFTVGDDTPTKIVVALLY